MALMCARLIRRNIKNPFAVASRLYAEDTRTPDPLELATGLEKAELLQIQAGNDDPFRLKAIKRKPSTKSNPNIVQSYYDVRMVGCVCEEDSSSIVWMWVFKGEPRRCMCGHWFKLEEYKPF